MDIIALLIVELVLLAILARHIRNYKRYQREMDEIHIMLMRINDEIVQMTRSIK